MYGTDFDLDFETDEWEEETAQLDEKERWKTPVWRWSPELKSSNEPIQLEFLLVAPFETVSPVLPSSAKVAAVAFLPNLATEKNSWDVSGLQNGCTLFQVSPAVMVLGVPHVHKDDGVFNWTAAFFQTIKPKRVVILDNLGLDHYYPLDRETDLMPPIYRQLKTSSSTQSLPADAPFLEPPNMITGMTAALMTRCDVLRIPANAFINIGDVTMMPNLLSKVIKSYSITNVFDIKLVDSKINERLTNLYL
ncbi:Proteasome assembly chaperone 1 [Chytridiales sp. JEL 0842]|nr:Proteasome assembly chaperone 1 [Chytridiales sp. JEL 0842]